MLTEQHIESLKVAFNGVTKLPDDVIDQLLKHWQAVRYKRKQIITRAGDVESYLYFVADGVQRCFAQHGDKQATIVFTYPYSFAGVLDSFLLQKAADYEFETLTKSTLLRINYKSFMRIVNENPVMERWMRLVLSNVVSGLLSRQKELSIYSSAEKLEIIFKRSPQLFRLISHKYIASYIGVDVTNFSKLMSKLNA